MKKSYISILLLFLVMILAVSAVSAAEDIDTSDSDLQAVDEAPVEEVASEDVEPLAATDDADVVADPGDGNNFTSLQTIVDTKYSHTLQKDYTRVEGDSDISISGKTFTLIGNNYKIDANNLGGIFKVDSDATLILVGVTLVNGNSDYGGAIYNEGLLTISECKLTNNTASANGGAIYNVGTIESFSSSTFENNKASNGAALYTTTDTEVRSSTFDGNIAVNKGGAIYADENVALTVENSIFMNNEITKNSYSNGGAAIFNLGNNLNVRGSRFVNNLAPWIGSTGAISSWSTGTVYIKDSYFERNVARFGAAIELEELDQKEVAVENCTFYNNTGYVGVGINANDNVKYLNVTKCTFDSNNFHGPQGAPTTGAMGAGICVGTNTVPVTLEISYSVFKNNYGDDKNGSTGAAIRLANCASGIIDNCTFENNYGTRSAAISSGTFKDDGDVTLVIKDSTFINNQATDNITVSIDEEFNAKIENCDIQDSNKYSVYNSGTLELSENNIPNGVYSKGTIISQINATILNNETVTTNDGTYLINATVTDDNGNLMTIVNGLTFVTDGAEVEAVYNATTGVYEGLMTLPAPGIYTVNITYIDEDKLNVKTATINNYKGTFQDLQNKIDNAISGTLDLAYDFAFTPELGDSEVNGIIIDEDLTINGNGHTISGSNAARIFNITAGTLTLTNVTVCNGAASEGAGVYVANGATLAANDAVFSNNIAQEYDGGAIYTNGGSINLTSCVLDSNDVTKLEARASENHGGAAIYANNAMVTLTNTNVINNGKNLNRTEGDLVNGVLNLLNSQTTIENCLFENNNGVYGGAIYAEDGTITISKSSFLANNAYCGGAIQLEGNLNFEIKDTIFTENNKAVGIGSPGYTAGGGAIFIKNAGGSIDNITVKDSYSAQGGAVDIESTKKTNITGSTFENNHADNLAGALYLYAPSITVDNCTFKNNSADKGGAIFIYDNRGGSAATINNVIFDSNNATNAGALWAWDNVAISDSRFIDNTATETGGAIVFTNYCTDSSLTNSNFTGNTAEDGNAIYNNQGVITLSKNNVSSEKADIVSTGIIKSTIYIEILNNGTTYHCGDITLQATVTDDIGNLMDITGLKFKVNDTANSLVDAKYNPDNRLYEGIYTPKDAGIFNIDANCTTSANLVIITTANITIVKSLIDIQNMIDAADAGDIIELTGDYAYVEEFDSSIKNGIVVNKTVTIDGKGYTISGSDAARIFNVGNNAVLNLSNVTLTKGKALNGGAVYVNAGAELNADYVNFDENTAAERGGAIWSAGTVTIDNSGFDSNNITERKNNVDNGGAAIYNYGTLNVDHSSFTNDLKNYVVRTGDNNNPQFIEAVVFNSGKAVINNSYFENNSGTYGGAIASYPILGATKASLTVENSDFVNNLAYCGAAIYIAADKGEESYFSIDNCTFIGNNATGIGSYGYTSAGGAIVIVDIAEGTIKNSKFYNNTATVGGAVDISSNNNANNVIDVEIDNCDFENNTAVGSPKREAVGGAIRTNTKYATGDILNLTVNNSNFTNNKAAAGGSAIYSNGTLTLSGNNVTSGNAEIEVGAKGFITSTIKVTILDGEVKTIETLEAELSAKVTDDEDNLIKDAQFKFTINDEEVAAVYNAANKLYEATYTLPSAGIYPVNITYASDDELEVENATVKSIYGTFTQLQQLIDNATDTLVLPYNFTYNAEIDGDALKAGVVINKALTVDGNGSTISGADAARIFQLNANNINITNTTFTNGHANTSSQQFADWGGAIYSNGAYNSHVISDCKFYNNTAYNGGAIYLSSDGSDIIGCEFEDNNATASGGAVFLYGLNDAISDSTFKFNMADELGGAVACYSGQQAAEITNSVFIGNAALKNGGAVSMQKAAGKITDSNFTGNTAYNGGAVYWGANGGSITGGEFIENKAFGDLGGAIFAEGTGLTLTSTFTENYADNGGAIAVFKDATITESTFTNNTAKNYGGAIYVNSSAKLDITKSAMKNNSATVGSSIYSNGTIGSTIVNATILDNKTLNDTGLGDLYVLNATLTDDMGNSIYDPNFRFTVNGVEIEDAPLYHDGTGLYTLGYAVEKAGLNVISTSYSAAGLQVFTGALDIPLANVTEFTVKVESIVEGENATVFVTLIGVNDAGLNAIVTVIVNNEDHAVNVVNGTGNITIDGLAHGQYPVVAMFEDPNYEPAINSTVFYVKGATKLTVESVEANYSDIITITVNLTDSEGNPLTGIVNVMGEDVFVENGVGTFTIDTQPDVGTYNWTAVYEGNNDYMNSSADFTVTVNVKELTEDDLYIEISGDAPDNVTVYIEGPVGEYNVTVDGQTVTVPVVYDEEDGFAWGEANITGLTPGVKVATISLDDPQYKLAEDVSTKEFEYLGYPEYTVNITGTYPNAVINIEGPDGNYTVSIDEDHQYEITVKDGVGSQNVSGLFAGDYEAYVEFEEQDGYHGVDSWVDFTIAKAPLDIAEPEVIGDMVIGSQINITFTLPTDVDPSNVSAFMDGEPVDVFIINETTGVYTLVLYGFTAAEGHYFVVQVNDPNYEDAIAEVYFSIEKITPALEVNDTVGEWNESVDIPIKLTGADGTPITGDVIVTVSWGVDGKTQVVTLNETGEGVATFAITESLGNLTVTAKYYGDDTYYAVEKTATLTITDSMEAKLVVVADSQVPYNDTVYVNVTLTNARDAVIGNATITYTVDGGEVQTAKVNEDGFVSIPVTGLAGGKHTIEVKFNNESYSPVSESVTVTVTPIAPVVTSNVTENAKVGENVTITIIAPGLTGNFTVTVDSDPVTFDLPVIDGVAIINVTGLAAGHHSYEVIYNGDENYTTGTDANSFDVAQVPTETALDITVPENSTAPVISVELPEDATGYLLVDIDGDKKYYAPLVNGSATIQTDSLDAGNHTVNVTYTGDDKYAKASVSKEITINTIPVNLTASAANIEVGQNATIIVKLPEGVDGVALVELDGVYYPVTDGKAVIENLTEGTYTATVTFMGNGLYEDNETTVTFNVTKVKVSPEQAFNITAPENSTSQVISVNLPEDATGYLLLDINGTQTHVPLVNGKANVTVPTLAEGTYNATITYTGDDKYGPITTTKEINVTSNVPENALNIPDSAKSDEPTTYSISLPSNATGYLEVDVDGTKYVAALNNGSASVTIPALPAGNHNVTVTYTGDANYSPVSKATTLSVAAPVFNLSNNKNVNVVYSAKANYKVLVTRDGKAVGAGQTVTFKFNGKTYTAKTDSKGYATLNLNTKVKVKKYTITATYNGVTVKNTVNVKHLIKASNKKIKKSKKVNKIKVKTNKVNGKYLKGKKLTLKIKGKKVKAKINKKGVATFKLKKSITKKLKAGKKYKYTVTYGKDKVTKKVKVRR